MTVTAEAYSWVRRVPSSLLQKDTAPLVGYPPPFPWEKFAEQLTKQFSLSNFSIHGSEPQWRSADTLLHGLENELIPLHVSASGITGTACCVFAESDLVFFMSTVLNQKPEVIRSVDPDFREGFTYFLAIEILNAIAVNYDKSLNLRLSKKEEFPKEDCLSIDIKITLGEKEILARILLEPAFLEGWKQKYNRRPDLFEGTNIARSVSVTVHLEGGRVTLSPSELEKVRPGDLLLLDFCSLRPEGGIIMLTIQGIPLFRGKLKDGNLKIIEYAEYFEGGSPMAKKPGSEEENENEEEDLSSFDEEFEEGTEFEEEEETDYGETEEETLTEEGEEPTEELEEEQEEGEEKEEEEEAHEPEKPITAATAVPKPSQFSATNLPMTVVVEVGRIQLTLQKLLLLQPGNLLELGISPADGVDLVVNGLCVGRGELVLLGESLGIRVLEIG